MKTNWKKVSYRFSTIVLLGCVSGYIPPTTDTLNVRVIIYSFLTKMAALSEFFFTMVMSIAQMTGRVLLKPIVEHYRGYAILRFFRRDAVFADPNLYCYL